MKNRVASLVRGPGFKGATPNAIPPTMLNLGEMFGASLSLDGRHVPVGEQGCASPPVEHHGS